ncbi:GSCOCG00013670001-RA-CDS [Cotesia congregata]|nr:GSCOCG00013670001-RA-CDS [Cotesia congregata]
METWEQPCGTPLAASLKRSPQRHSVHRALKRVRIQLRVAQNHFRKDLKVVHELYSKVYKVLRGQYHQSWLPKNQLEWYYNEVWCKEKSKKAEYALPKLHDALQRFAITFHLLKRFRLNSNINVEYTMNKRNDIMAGMQNEVHRMLCEVETAILNLGLQLPQSHKAIIVTSNSDWAMEGDLTLMLIQDWGVLRLYQAFLNDWTRAFRNATAIGPGTCDPNATKPIFYRAKQKNPKKKRRLKPKKLDPNKKKQNIKSNININDDNNNFNSTTVNNSNNNNNNNTSNNNNRSGVVRNNEIVVGVNGKVIHSRRRGVRQRMAKNRRKKTRQ